MCSTLINYITIHDNFVKESTAEKNLYPHEYHTSINKYYTDMLTHEGKDNVILDILKSFDDGIYQSSNTKNNLVYLYAIEVNRSRLHELYNIIYDYDFENRVYKHSEQERKTAQEEKDNLLLQGYYKALEIKKTFRGKKYYILFDASNIVNVGGYHNYIARITDRSIHYNTNISKAKQFSRLECEYYKLTIKKNYSNITNIDFLEV